MNAKLDEIRERISLLKCAALDYPMDELLDILVLLAEELERVDKALADKADEHPDEGIQFGGPINFPKQP